VELSVAVELVAPSHALVATVALPPTAKVAALKDALRAEILKSVFARFLFLNDSTTTYLCEIPVLNWQIRNFFLFIYFNEKRQITFVDIISYNN
jgi:hypothetical protein